jgi:lipoate-protein ligase B
MSSGTTNGLSGVWGSSGSDVFAVGDGGNIVHHGGERHVIYLPLALKNHTR